MEFLFPTNAALVVDREQAKIRACEGLALDRVGGQFAMKAAVNLEHVIKCQLSTHRRKPRRHCTEAAPGVRYT